MPREKGSGEIIYQAIWTSGEKNYTLGIVLNSTITLIALEKGGQNNLTHTAGVKGVSHTFGVATTTGVAALPRATLDRPAGLAGVTGAGDFCKEKLYYCLTMFGGHHFPLANRSQLSTGFTACHQGLFYPASVSDTAVSTFLPV